MPYVEYRDERGKKQKVFMGAFSYFLGEQFEERDRVVVQIHPAFPTTTKSKAPATPALGSVSTSRSLEFCKEPEKEVVELYASASSDDIEIFEKELTSSYPGTTTSKTDKTEPEFVIRASEYVKQGYTAYFFNVEQEHALVGMQYDTTQAQTLVDGIIRSLKGRGAWVQIAWCDYDWTAYIEQASMVFQKAVDEIRRGITTTTPAFGGFGQNFTPKIGMSTSVRPHPAAGSTIDVHGDRIAREYFEKGQRHAVIVSIRGMVLSKTPPEQIAAALHRVMIDQDVLTPWFYPDNSQFGGARMIRWLRSRALPNPAKMLEMHAKGGFLREWGEGRELIPVLCVTSEELPILVHLPQDPQLHGIVKFAMSGGLPPSVVPKRDGIVITEEGLAVSWDDLNRGIYLIGMPGTGKTTIQMNLVTGLQKANEDGTFPNATIIIDPKGDDSLKLLRKLHLDPDKVTFCDPDMTGFAINPLGIPPHSPDDTKKVRALHADYLFSWLRETFGSGIETAPQMIRFFRAISTALYRLSDHVTFTDIYHAGVLYQTDSKRVIQELSKPFDPTNPADALMLTELEALAQIDPKQMVPLQNRLSPFTQEYLMEHLCVPDPAVYLDQMLEPGRTTIIRLSKRDLGTDMVTWFEAAVILGLWFAIMERARKIADEKKRVQVVIMADEFQNMQDLEAIPMVLAEARSAKAGLVLAHQTSEQLSDETFGEIQGTTSMKGIGRVSGADAKRLSSVNPLFSKEFVQTAATQPDYTWLFQLRAGKGEETQPPIQQHILDQSPDINTEEQVSAFIAEMKRRQTPKPVEMPLLEQLKEQKCEFVKDLTEPYGSEPSKRSEYAVLTALEKGPNHEEGICDFAGSSVLTRGAPETKELLNRLIGKGLIEVADIRGRKDRPVIVYRITDQGRKLVACDFAICSTKDAGPAAIENITKLGEAERQNAFKQGRFFMTAKQPEGADRKIDCVEYDFRENADAVELESISHVRTHSSQLVDHMRNIPRGYRNEIVVIFPESEAEVRKLIAEQLTLEQRKRIVVHVVEPAGVRSFTV